MIVGKLTVGPTAVTIAPDTKEVVRYAVGQAGWLPKLSAYLDGLAGGTHDATVKAVVYDAAGNLIGTSAEVTVPAGSVAAWYDFDFSEASGVSGVSLLEAGYDFGLIVGGIDTVVRFHSSGAGTSKKNADTYSDGPANPFGTATAGTDDMTIFGDVFEPYSAPVNEYEFYYARLPFHESQAVFGSTQPDPTTATVVEAAWHGTALDPERGSFAVVDENGPLKDLVGERIKVSLGSKAVYAFVHNSLSLPDVTGQALDLSLPRRLWMALALPGDDTHRLRVEKMQ